MQRSDPQRKEDLENDTQKRKGEVLVIKQQIGRNIHTRLALAPPLPPATSLASLVSHFIFQPPPPARSSLQWPPPPLVHGWVSPPPIRPSWNAPCSPPLPSPSGTPFQMPRITSFPDPPSAPDCLVYIVSVLSTFITLFHINSYV